jgi:hypothetical protein
MLGPEWVEGLGLLGQRLAVAAGLRAARLRQLVGKPRSQALLLLRHP